MSYLPFLCYSGKSMQLPLLGPPHEWTAHSFEAFSRMCVSGLILDPKVPIYAVFTSPFADHSIRPVSTAPIVHSAAASTHPPTTLHCNGTLPYCLSGGSASVPMSMSSPSRYNISASLGAASLRLARDITPYLRHSWTRIDAIAVVAFWIAFILAQTGVEHGRYHIGIFRALSVLRTARLLAITSGTTVSTTSRSPFGRRKEKLTRVCFFADHHALSQDRAPAARQRGVFRAICRGHVFVCPAPCFWTTCKVEIDVLTRIIGVQTLKGSFRRSCYLEPTLGEPETQLTQSCGGYVDPGDFSVMPYIAQDGRGVTIKGYICPVGQVCRVSQCLFCPLSARMTKNIGDEQSLQ
jgi:hypothetical protein